MSVIPKFSKVRNVYETSPKRSVNAVPVYSNTGGQSPRRKRSSSSQAKLKNSNSNTSIGLGARKTSQRSLKYNDSTGILPRYTLAHNKRAGSNKGMITLASQSGLKSHRMGSGRKRNSVLYRSSESAQLMPNDAAN